VIVTQSSNIRKYLLCVLNSKQHNVVSKSTLLCGTVPHFRIVAAVDIKFGQYLIAIRFNCDLNRIRRIDLGSARFDTDSIQNWVTLLFQKINEEK